MPEATSSTQTRPIPLTRGFGSRLQRPPMRSSSPRRAVADLAFASTAWEASIRAGITSVRAAAISATYILVTRAAIELDIDPEEFDVIEPRPHTLDGVTVPLLQFTDHLVNGAGFLLRASRRRDRWRASLIAKLIRSIVRDAEKYPLVDFPGSRNRRTTPSRSVRSGLLPVPASLRQSDVPWPTRLATRVVVPLHPERRDLRLRTGGCPQHGNPSPE